MQNQILYVWYLLTAVTILAALLVVLAKNPIHSVLSLVVTFFCLSAHYVLLNAQFLAVVNIIVYAGAIMVLFLFVIMFLNLREYTEETKSNFAKLGAAIVGGVTLVAIIAALKKVQYPMPMRYDVRTGFVETLGEVLFRDYLLPFELVTVLFFVAMVGAVMLGKREKGERHF
ncbi:MAG: NADH-quinone oxidoreductase subunit J [Siphonobacter aquaeclarae]|nr:NADH-quinone oxidoreductase subunit J [Siphonobacter aquaeclarae]